MKDVIYKYLNSNYRVSVASLSNYRLYDIHNQKSQSIHSIFKQLKKIFGIGDEDIELIVNSWLQEKATELNNKITDIQ